MNDPLLSNWLRKAYIEGYERGRLDDARGQDTSSPEDRFDDSDVLDDYMRYLRHPEEGKK